MDALSNKIRTLYMRWSGHGYEGRNRISNNSNSVRTNYIKVKTDNTQETFKCR